METLNEVDIEFVKFYKEQLDIIKCKGCINHIAISIFNDYLIEIINSKKYEYANKKLLSYCKMLNNLEGKK